MSGCDFPVMTQADVAALGDIERATARAANGCDAALLRAFSYRCWQRLPDGSGRPRLLTGHSGVCVPNRARHMPRKLLNNLSMFADDYWRETLSQGQTHLMFAARERSFGADRRISSSLRPRRVTSNGLVIVRGRR